MLIKEYFFVKVPRTSSNLNWAEDEEIIDALNRILKLLFIKAKSNDSVIHFFDSKERKDISDKKIYSVFNNKDEFFTYLYITGNDKKIFGEIIPEEYPTIIDNASLDISIKNILDVVGKLKKDEKSLK